MIASDIGEKDRGLSQVDEPRWGEKPDDHFGYASDEERMAKRGLEDWELVETIPESQKKIPYWFIGVTVAVLLVAVGLSFPFWGLRPGDERPWVDWGFIIALFYVAVGSAFVRFMVNLYGSSMGGTLDSDKNNKEQSHELNAEK
jgi:hypothetical protein